MRKPTRLAILPQLHRATHRVALYIASLEGVEVTQAEAVVLAYLSDRGSAAISQLHRTFGHRRSTLTSVVDRLVTRGLAERSLSSTDRRSFVVSLTRKGSTLAAYLKSKLAELEAAALSDVPERDVAAFLRILARLDRVQTRER